MGIGSTKAQRRAAVAAAVKRVVTVLVLGVLIVSALYLYDYLTTSPRFAIETVELRGVARIDGDDLRDMLGDLEGQNLLLAPLDDYESRLEMHPRVESVTMHRVVPSTVICNVVERQPVALVFTDRFLEVDRNGMVMDDDAYTPMLDLPIITGIDNEDVRPGRVSESPALHSALEVLRLARDLGGELSGEISELHVGSLGVVVRSVENDQVLVLGDSDYENRLRKYFLLRDTLERERKPNRRVVDLRFQDQVVLRGGM